MSKEFVEFLENWAYGDKEIKTYNISFTERELASISLATKLLYKQLGADDTFEIEMKYLKSVIEKVSLATDEEYKIEEDSSLKVPIFSHEKE